MVGIFDNLISKITKKPFNKPQMMQAWINNHPQSPIMQKKLQANLWTTPQNNNIETQNSFKAL